MSKFARYESHDEYHELEPWESANTRQSREAWRGSRRKEASADRESARDGEAVHVPSNLFRRLAAAAAREINQQLILRHLQQEVQQLRDEIAQLREERQAFVEGPATLTYFDAELVDLEMFASTARGEGVIEVDLGPLIDEWT